MALNAMEKSTLTELRKNLDSLEECSDQLRKYDLLSPKHVVAETVKRFSSTYASIASRIEQLKSCDSAARDDDTTHFANHLRLLEERLKSLEQAQQRIVENLNHEEARFQEEWNRQAISDSVCSESVQTQLVSVFSSSHSNTPS